MDEKIRRALVGLLRFLLRYSKENVVCAPCPCCGYVVEIVDGIVTQDYDPRYGTYANTYPCQEVEE